VANAFPYSCCDPPAFLPASLSLEQWQNSGDTLRQLGSTPRFGRASVYSYLRLRGLKISWVVSPGWRSAQLPHLCDGTDAAFTHSTPPMSSPAQPWTWASQRFPHVRMDSIDVGLLHILGSCGKIYASQTTWSGPNPTHSLSCLISHIHPSTRCDCVTRTTLPETQTLGSKIQRHNLLDTGLSIPRRMASHRRLLTQSILRGPIAPQARWDDASHVFS
jgi:hypothetical protein